MKAISSTISVNIFSLNFGFTYLQVCVSSVDPAAFPAAVEAGALMVWPLLIIVSISVHRHHKQEY